MYTSIENLLKKDLVLNLYDSWGAAIVPSFSTKVPPSQAPLSVQALYSNLPSPKGLALQTGAFTAQECLTRLEQLLQSGSVSAQAHDKTEDKVIEQWLSEWQSLKPRISYDTCYSISYSDNGFVHEFSHSMQHGRKTIAGVRSPSIQSGVTWIQQNLSFDTLMEYVARKDQFEKSLI
jgi:hypothetical protein